MTRRAKQILKWGGWCEIEYGASAKPLRGLGGRKRYRRSGVKLQGCSARLLAKTTSRPDSSDVAWGRGHRIFMVHWYMLSWLLRVESMTANELSPIDGRQGINSEMNCRLVLNWRHESNIWYRELVMNSRQQILRIMNYERGCFEIDEGPRHVQLCFRGQVGVRRYLGRTIPLADEWKGGCVKRWIANSVGKYMSSIK